MSDTASLTFDVSTDYFSLFSLSDTFDVDLSALKAKYLELQQQCHPDRYASASEVEQRKAVQLTAYLNQAYDALRSPLKRAIYMLERRGQPFDAESQINADTEFLLSQLELREQLETSAEADDSFAKLDQLMAQAEQDYSAYQKEFVGFYNQEDWSGAALCIHKLMFASKLIAEIRLKEELLED